MTNVATLSILLLGSVIISLIGGYVTAMIAGVPATISAAVLGALLLATGIYFQSRMWNVIPLWYNVIFLILLVPMTFAGARMRAGMTPY
jgi:Na+/H+ antiporter NhaD/arsenite permease-like protein